MSMATAPSGAEPWEELQGLKLQEPPPELQSDAVVAPDDVGKSISGEHTQTMVKLDEPQPARTDVETVDSAILQALADSKERQTVLRIEADVERFMGDSAQDTLAFPTEFSNYQRLLAHRIAQHYGLHTSTSENEQGLLRVVAKKTTPCRLPQTRLADLKISNDVALYKGGPKLLMKRPTAEDKHRAHQNRLDAPLPQNLQSRTAKEREEDYNQARERIIGKSMEGLEGPNSSGRGRFGGRVQLGRASGGRGRKAVFRDRDRELQDPDYTRDENRMTAGFDPNYKPHGSGVYNMPTYGGEFPTLPNKPPTANNHPMARAQEYAWQRSSTYPAPPPPPPSPPAQKSYNTSGFPAAQAGAVPGMGRPPYGQMPAYAMSGMGTGYGMAMGAGIPPPPPPHHGMYHTNPMAYAGMHMAQGMSPYAFIPTQHMAEQMSHMQQYPMYAAFPGGAAYAQPYMGMAGQRGPTMHMMAGSYSTGNMNPGPGRGYGHDRGGSARHAQSHSEPNQAPAAASGSGPAHATAPQDGKGAQE